jgi:hypothetical protein
MLYLLGGMTRSEVRMLGARDISIRFVPGLEEEHDLRIMQMKQKSYSSCEKKE